jgi:hypothetical protein
MGFKIRSGPRMHLRGLKVVQAACWPLPSSFRESQRDAKTLPEGTASFEDLSGRGEAWNKLKTQFAWVHPFNQGPSVCPDHLALRRHPPEKLSHFRRRHFQSNMPARHRFSIAQGSFGPIECLRHVKKKALKRSSFGGGSWFVERSNLPDKASRSPRR